MGCGIAIVGGNGSGKTTLGKRLAEMLGFKHMDAEDYFFRESPLPYSKPRTHEEVRELMLADIEKHQNFVLSSVNGDYGDVLNAHYDCIVYIKVPTEIRIARVKQRSLDKFGSRILEGGDMYEREQNFFQFVASRTMDKTDAWVQEMCLPVLYVDGTEPIERNAAMLKEKISALKGTSEHAE